MDDVAHELAQLGDGHIDTRSHVDVLAAVEGSQQELEGTTVSLAEMHARLDRLEQAVNAANLPGHAELLRELPVWAHRHALAVEAQTQRVEECLAFLEVQHEVIREILDRLQG